MKIKKVIDLEGNDDKGLVIKEMINQLESYGSIFLRDSRRLDGNEFIEMNHSDFYDSVYSYINNNNIKDNIRYALKSFVSDYRNGIIRIDEYCIGKKEVDGYDHFKFSKSHIGNFSLRSYINAYEYSSYEVALIFESKVQGEDNMLNDILYCKTMMCPSKESLDYTVSAFKNILDSLLKEYDIEKGVCLDSEELDELSVSYEELETDEEGILLQRPGWHEELDIEASNDELDMISEDYKGHDEPRSDW